MDGHKCPISFQSAYIKLLTYFLKVYITVKSKEFEQSVLWNVWNSTRRGKILEEIHVFCFLIFMSNFPSPPQILLSLPYLYINLSSLWTACLTRGGEKKTKKDDNKNVRLLTIYNWPPVEAYVMIMRKIRYYISSFTSQIMGYYMHTLINVHTHVSLQAKYVRAHKRT